MFIPLVMSSIKSMSLEFSLNGTGIHCGSILVSHTRGGWVASPSPFTVMTNIFVTEFSETFRKNSIKRPRLPIRFYSDVHLQLKQFSMVLPNGLETVRQFFTGIRLEHNTHLQHLFLFQVARKLH